MLFNALKISEAFPEYQNYVGVEWLTAKIFKVNKFQFARLLAIGTIDGSLFHKQGNFTTHGFIQVSHQQLIQAIGIERAEIINSLDDERFKLERRNHKWLIMNSDTLIFGGIATYICM